MNQPDSSYQVIAWAIIALLIDLLAFCLDGHKPYFVYLTILLLT